jgi:hypothetical protein
MFIRDFSPGAVISERKEKENTMSQRKILVKYKESQNYRREAVSGVFGGPTPAGGLMCNFFLETRAVPDQVEIEIDSSGAAIEKPVTEEEGEVFIREILFGVLLSPQVARSIGDWLIQRSRELMEKPILQ